jgi:two-component system, sensor histidine kinase LadS
VVLLSLALSSKYRSLEYERNLARENELKAMAEGQLLISKQNELLERKIKERTAELEQKQHEVMQQNDELLKAQVTIKAQNDRLQKYNEDLEREVASRTMEIQMSNSELANSVQKLEQYAFITAHNLRAPVARLKGLMYLLDMDPSQENLAEFKDILQKVKKSAFELDDVISDINKILELNQDKKSENEAVSIPDVITKTKRILKENIQQYGVQIYEMINVPLVHANPVYLDSIFYNLMSNAIKYRSPNRPIEITISSQINRTNEWILISFQDNGIGIDLAKHGDKLFGMYRRFHEHVDGKGLGLYLVKSQIEMMNGYIEVHSELDKGTRFDLYFRKPSGE